ncbi:MAG: MFS transporter [Candidatus Hodarchaeota archaeon]
MGKKPDQEIFHSTKHHFSYALGSFFDDFIATAFSMRVYVFFDTEVELPKHFLTIAIVLYGIWNMVNDPFAGYISDRQNRFTRRWGKRFFWFTLTAIPCAVTFTLIFSVPDMSNMGIFCWLLILICAFDAFFSFWNTNWMASFPLQFRTQKERTRVAGFQTILSQVGLTLGMLLPPLLLKTDQKSSYVGSAMMVSLICCAVAVVIMPSLRSKEMQHINDIKKQEQNKINYFKTLKTALKQKNFISYLIAYLAQTVLMTVMLASIPYLVTFVLEVDEDLEILISGAFLVGGLVSVPFWIKIARKHGNRVGYIFGTGLTSSLLFVSFFFPSFETYVAGAIALGFATGAPWSLMYPMFSDVIDEIVMKTGERKEGIYYGFRTLIGRFSIAIQALSFGIIHTLTGFDQSTSSQDPLAQMGIKMIMSLVPAVFYALGCLAMWRMNDLTPEKVAGIKEKLKKLDL